MSGVPHRVRRLALHVRAPSPRSALALRQELRGQTDALTGALARVFDAAAPAEILHVPRLELRVRLTAEEDIVAALARCIAEELPGQLRRRATGGPSAAPTAGPPPAADAELPRDASPVPADSQANAATATPARARLLLHYLRTGSLAWPLVHTDTAVTLAELRDAAAGDPAPILATLTETPDAATDVAFWWRWLQLLPDERWSALARTMSLPSVAPAGVVDAVAALARDDDGALPRYTRLWLAAAAIVGARRTMTRAELAAILAPALHAHGHAPIGPDHAAARPAETPRGPSHQADSDEHAGPSQTRVEPPARLDEARALTRNSGLEPGSQPDATPALNRHAATERAARPPEPLAAEVLVARLPEPAATAFLAWLTAPSGPVVTAPPRPLTHASGRTSAASRVHPPGRDPASARADPDAPRAAEPRPPLAGDARTAPFGQRVHHAGLVLLHPYLPRFFESTGVRAARGSLDPAALPRAAALLHCLAVGDADIHEFELDFIKLLLGLPLGAPLPVSAGLLRPEDREEAGALLAAVLDHWRALGRTSVQGLRGSFLRRTGLLREDDRGARLQVEPAAFDVLLGQLPWGIGTIKLPWMPRPLFTEWPTP